MTSQSECSTCTITLVLSVLYIVSLYYRSYDKPERVQHGGCTIARGSLGATDGFRGEVSVVLHSRFTVVQLSALYNCQIPHQGVGEVSLMESLALLLSSSSSSSSSIALLLLPTALFNCSVLRAEEG